MSKPKEAPSRRTFLKLLGVAPAGWLACQGDANGAADTLLSDDGYTPDTLDTPDTPGGAGPADGAGDTAACRCQDARAGKDTAARGGSDAKTDASDGGPRAADAGAGPDASDGGPGALDAGASDVATSEDGSSTSADGSTRSQDATSDASQADTQSTDAGSPDTGPPEVCEVTGPDAKGPYYLAGPPWTTVIAGPDEPGERLYVAGYVVDAACNPLAGALVDVWQADATGTYDSSTVKYRLRGQMLASATGAYAFETIIPGGYPQNGSFRPKHIHFTVSSPGYWPITTQLYFEGDPYLQPNDPCSTCKSDDETHIRPLVPALGKPGYDCAFDVVLAKK